MPIKHHPGYSFNAVDRHPISDLWPQNKSKGCLRFKDQFRFQIV